MPLDTVLWAKEFFCTLLKGMRARPLKLVCLAGAATLAEATGATREAQTEAICAELSTKVQCERKCSERSREKNTLGRRLRKPVVKRKRAAQDKAAQNLALNLCSLSTVVRQMLVNILPPTFLNIDKALLQPY